MSNTAAPQAQYQTPPTAYRAMAFSQLSPRSHKSTLNMSVPQLLTPEEPMLDSFDRKTVLPPMHSVPSPPESPAFNVYHTTTAAATASEHGFSQHDGILYPDHNSTTPGAVDRPLFDTASSYHWTSPQRQQSPSLHSSSSSPRLRRDSPFSHDAKSVGSSHSVTSSPLSEPELEIEPVGPVALNNRFGPDYYRLMLAQMEGHRAQRLANRQLPPVKRSHAQNRDQYTWQQVSRLGRASLADKPRPVVKATPKPKAAKAAPVHRVESPAKRSRRQPLSPELPAALAAWQQTPAPKPRTRAAPSKKVDDKDYSEWASLPDYSPPASTLSQSGKKLTATWNNSNSLNLDNDPDKQHLHPQEYEIASTLRLKCNQYLASKRRIFAAKVKALKEGREFNKTSAQNCCTIDVNKASRLWMAFDGVGWFDDQWFQKFL